MLKPYRNHLNLALMRAKGRLEQRAVSEPATEPIIVKDRSRVYVIPVEALDFVEAQGDYVALHSGGRHYLKLQPISSLESTLDSTRFVRVHRSKIVNLERIARIAPHTKESTITLSDGTRLPLSRTGYVRLMEAMEEPRTGPNAAAFDAAVPAS
jgi:two-component system LytT family response regulator